MLLIHNRSLFTDKQVLKLQETPESIPEGATPQTVTLCVYEDMVDVARPGDRVRVTGIYRASPIRARATQRTLKHIYRTFLDVVHFQISSDISLAHPRRRRRCRRYRRPPQWQQQSRPPIQTSLEEEEEEEEEEEIDKDSDNSVLNYVAQHEIDTERQTREQYIRALARDPNIYTTLTKSFGLFPFRIGSSLVSRLSSHLTSPHFS
jgi:DNA replication licensing factor MCM4